MSKTKRMLGAALLAALMAVSVVLVACSGANAPEGRPVLNQEQFNTRFEELQTDWEAFEARDFSSIAANAPLATIAPIMSDLSALFDELEVLIYNSVSNDGIDTEEFEGWLMEIVLNDDTLEGFMSSYILDRAIMLMTSGSRDLLMDFSTQLIEVGELLSEFSTIDTTDMTDPAEILSFLQLIEDLGDALYSMWGIDFVDLVGDLDLTDLDNLNEEDLLELFNFDILLTGAQGSLFYRFMNLRSGTSFDAHVANVVFGIMAYTFLHTLADIGAGEDIDALQTIGLFVPQQLSIAA